MVRARDDYAVCYGCCPASLRTGLYSVAVVGVVQGLYGITEASMSLAKEKYWTDTVELVFGFGWLFIGIYTFYVTRKRSQRGMSVLSWLLKSGAVMMAVTDALDVAEMLYTESTAVLAGNICIVLLHVVFYFNLFWILGTVKSAGEVFAAGGDGSEFVRAAELRFSI